MNTKDPGGFYKVRVTDYAIPAFCDSEVNYYDTAGNIRRLYEQSLNGRIQEEAERCLAAMEEHLSGRGTGNIRLQYEEPKPLLSRVMLLGKHSWECGPQKYLFYNTWNWEHDVATDGVQVEAVYLEDPASVIPVRWLIRCVKLQIKHPRMLDIFGKQWLNCWDTGFWGYPHMIMRRGPGILVNSLYYPDHSFQAVTEAERELRRYYDLFYCRSPFWSQ